MLGFDMCTLRMAYCMTFLSLSSPLSRTTAPVPFNSMPGEYRTIRSYKGWLITQTKAPRKRAFCVFGVRFQLVPDRPPRSQTKPFAMRISGSAK